MIPEITISEEILYQGKVMDFSLRQVALPDGAQAQREIAINRGAVAIVPVTPANEVRLVRQFRAAAQKWVIEIPAGNLEDGEDPGIAAERELQEETGDQATHWHKLPGFFTSPAILTEYLHLYLATGLTPGASQPEFDEYIEVLTVPWQEALAMIRRAEIEDAKTIIGLTLAGLHLGWLQEQSEIRD